MRKIIQLSKLCDKNVLLYIYDDDLLHLYEYKNKEEFDLKDVQAMISPDQECAKFPVSKFTSYGDDDYELLTMRHLPKNQWENGLNELQEIVSELSKSPKMANQLLKSSISPPKDFWLNNEMP